QGELVASITKWPPCVYQTKRIPEYVASAFRAALTGRQGPAFLETPTDVLFRKVEENDVYFPQSYRPQGRVYPDPKVVKQAAEIIARAERPLVMAGSAIYWQDAHQGLRHFVEVAQAPVYLNAVGRGGIQQSQPA